MSRGIEERRIKEMTQILARERGARDDSAQRVKEVRALQLLIADLRKQAGDITSEVAAAEARMAQVLADMETEVAGLSAQIPAVASDVAAHRALLRTDAANRWLRSNPGTGLASFETLPDSAISTISGARVVRRTDGQTEVFSPALTLPCAGAAGADDLLDFTGTTTWNYPITFAAPPAVLLASVSAASPVIVTHAANPLHAALRAHAVVSIAAVTVHLVAIGREM